MERSAVIGPRIYNLFPLLAGKIEGWTSHLDRIAAMRFDWIYVNPFHLTGASHSLYAVSDYYAVDPRLESTPGGGMEELRAFIAAARERGLSVMIDLVVDRTAADAPLVTSHPAWYAHDTASAADVTVRGDVAELDYRDRPSRDGLVAYFTQVVRFYIELGVGGFRCDAAYKVPREVWAELVAAARALDPGALFAADTLGARLSEVAQLQGSGLDYVFNSAKWWDFEAPWLLEQYESYRHIAPSIAFPESHDTPRLRTELAARGITDAADIERAYRFRYCFAAVFSSGVMMPMGFEFGFGKQLDVVATRPQDWEEPLFDISPYVASVNAMKAALPALNIEGPERQITAAGTWPLGIVRTAGDDGVLALVNPDSRNEAGIAARRAFALAATAGLPAWAGPLREVTPLETASSSKPERNGTLALAPQEIRVFATASRPRPVSRSSRGDVETQTPPSLAAGFIGRTIVIEAVTPELDAGRFPVKRVVWDRFDVGADIYKEGHDVLAAAVRYRPHDEAAWQEAPLVYSYERDRWSGSFVLERNVRYLYTVAAWTDRYGTWAHDVSRKFDAGQDISLELAEGRLLVNHLRDRAKGRDRAALEATLLRCERATDPAARLGFLMSGAMAAFAARYEARDDMVRYDRMLEVVVDRPAARFSAWYEMFPRSQGDDPSRSGTFDDAARRLPALAALGFDVVYLPPIHPIGVSFRKGRNNTLGAGPHDPGSPWAIGNEHGGHMSVDPGLGSLEDFRRFVAACRARGMEVALDYALQCSPDHPYVKAHPEWFAFRPDGSIRYAENPPKKYQDIVNFDWTTSARDALWKELRDIVLFWIAQGVRIFRVDNPHTKPVAFWRWLIRNIQDAHPETIFLAEAFTRPKALHMLAKAGFTQSYSYFTWRNTKAELMEYLVELTQSAGREYLRPNFFANTPDILPPYLQTGGRPAFIVRLVLAATLSSLYGIYSGYEICENSALPGREEYADSEKYELKARDYDAAGNINAEIAAVNRIRRENRALHDLLTLRFYHATNDRVLWYAKATPERDNVVFVAVNLDPFATVESDLEIPLADLGLPGDATLEVEELLSARRVTWSGGRGWVRLDPQHNPADIFRVITPLPPGDDA